MNDGSNSFFLFDPVHDGVHTAASECGFDGFPNAHGFAVRHHAALRIRDDRVTALQGGQWAHDVELTGERLQLRLQSLQLIHDARL